MILERATHPEFVSNTYLVADGQGGPAFFIDAGGPVESLIEAAERHALTPTHVLLTHHHFDHVSEVANLRERWPDLAVLISERERDLLSAATAEDERDAIARYDTIEAGQTREFGALEVRPLHTPGHTAGMLSFLVTESPRGGTPAASAGAHPGAGAHSGAGAHPGGAHSGAGAHASPGGPARAAAVFTGDTLFKDSVGGVRAPGHSTYADLRDSIMGTLMELAPDTAIHPGHADATTVAREWQENPFVRVWRGLDREGTESCTALGEPATLVLLAADYDGGTKAWVRWQDGSDDIVPGSRVQRNS
jgi:hydroxyacylglutathione hydrolase